MKKENASRSGTFALGPKVFVVSLPKSGTNVVASTLKLFNGMKRLRGINTRMARHPLNFLPARSEERTCLVGINSPKRVNMVTVHYALATIRPWQFRTGHVPYQANVRKVVQDCAVRPIVVIRDPRDVVVSSIHYASKREGHFLASTMHACANDRERIKTMIRGGQTVGGIRFASIAEQLDLIEGWVNDAGVLTVRFEEIIGSKGEGSEDKQIDTIKELGAFTGLRIEQDKAVQIGAAMFGTGNTFRKGVIGGWREHFDDEISDLFRSIVGDRLERFGYAW